MGQRRRRGDQVSRTWTALYGSICTSKKLRACAEDSSRLFYLLLLTQADPWGRLEDDPEVLNVKVWPLLGKSEKDTEKALADLHEVGLITRHSHESVKFIQVEDWETHAGRHQGGSRGSPKFPESPRISPKVPGLSGEVRGLYSLSQSPSESESRRESAEREPDLHPATMNQKPVEPKKPRAPSGPEQTFIATWTRLFVQEVFDETGTPVAYGKLHAGDGPAVARLARERPHEVQDLQLVERRMLALLRSQEAFWLTNRNLRTLCSRWTDIASIPIADHNRRASRPQNAHEETLKNILATRPTHAQENAHGLSGTQRLDQPRDRQALGSLPALQGSARNGHAPAGAVREVHPGRRGPSHLDVAGLLRGIVPVDGPDQPESAR